MVVVVVVVVVNILWRSTKHKVEVPDNTQPVSWFGYDRTPV